MIEQQESPESAIRASRRSALRHLPNLITAVRIALVLPMCWLISAARYDEALLVAAVAGASDALDGFLAKRFGWQSWIGGMLDPIADKLLLVAAFLWLAMAGELPVWLVALVVGRDVAIVIGAIAYHNLVGRFDADPSRLSKLTTLVQIVFVLVLLVRLSGWIEVPPAVRMLLIWVTAGLTLASGMHYVWMWGARACHSTRSRN